MTDDDKIETIVTHLTESHLEISGGYPYDYTWIGDTLIVASLDHDGGAHIDEYDRWALITWVDRALELCHNDSNTDFAPALDETRP